MKTYYCFQNATEAVCEVRGEGPAYLLPLRLELRNHSPTGFAWGYNGSGPAQLALAMMADHCTLGNALPALSEAFALCFYQDFKTAIVARHDPVAAWSVTSDQIRTALAVSLPAPSTPFARQIAMNVGRAVCGAFECRPAPSIELVRASCLAVLIGPLGYQPQAAGVLASGILEEALS